MLITLMMGLMLLIAFKVFPKKLSILLGTLTVAALFCFGLSAVLGLVGEKLEIALTLLNK